MTTADEQEPPAESVPGPTQAWTPGMVMRAVQVRLRFLAVLAVSFLVVGQWDALRNRWDRLTRALPGASGGPSLTTVSNDTEYFCPMDPGVLSDWPGKCGVCNMALVRRKRGEAVTLPSGVVSRMQISPYRIQLAGVRTSPVSYQPLTRESRIEGTVVGEADGTTWVVELNARDNEIHPLAPGQIVEVAADGPRVSAKVVTSGRVDPANPPRVVLELADRADAFRTGLGVTLHVRGPVADLEPFRSMPAEPPPARASEPRLVYLCREHVEILREAPGPCPVDGRDALDPRPLLNNQRLRWWCPTHPSVVADRAGASCRDCGGRALVPRVVTYRPAGQVLAVPESAVVETGSRSVVYVETMPGMFDGVEVVLGPRCGDAYPVVRGLDPGQRVATAGAFLIDAETRLNPALASAYFGATRGLRDEPVRADAAPSRSDIPPELRALAERQKTCPVTGKLLGSMGPPVKVTVAGRDVLLCCEGCESSIRKSPEKFLAKPGVAAAAPATPP